MTQQRDIDLVKAVLDDFTDANEAFQRILDRTWPEYDEYRFEISVSAHVQDHEEEGYEASIFDLTGEKSYEYGFYGRTPREAVLNALKGIKDE